MDKHLAIQPQTIMIECVINANGGNTSAINPFAQQDQLIGRPIIALEVFSALDMPFSPVGSNLPVIPQALFPFAFLNIQRSGVQPLVSGQWFKYLPLANLRHVFNPTVNCSACLDKFMCDPMTIQWPDSNIAFPTSTTQSLQQYSVPIMVTYLLQQQDTEPYTMAHIRRR
jgi:hypothetical protein